MSYDSAAPPQANPTVRRTDRPPPRGPGPLGFLIESTLMGWRWLTRMRTALYLLAMLGLATLVATLIPQEPNVPSTVEAWREGTQGPGTLVTVVLDTIGAFDVYGSTLFLALLFLLYLSLTACLIPRVRAWVRLVRRSRPPRSGAVRAQPVVAFLEADQPAGEVRSAAEQLLRRGRWRLRDDEDDEVALPTQIAAEKGLWSREGGSLLFHISFYVLLAAVVFGQLAGFSGQVGVVERAAGFSDTSIAYWTQKPGRWWDDGDHAGWTLALDSFEIDWIRDPLAPGAGQPTLFASNVTVTGADGTVVTDRIEGNAPVVFDGMKVTQLDWGYAPRIRVEVDGEVVYDDFAIATVTDGGYFRTAVKAPAADPDVGLEVFLYPFAPDDATGEPRLTGAQFDDAPLAIFRQWRGDLQLGRTQQTVTQLDTSGLVSQGGGILRPGTGVTSDRVTVSFVELRRWVGFQVTNRPQLPWLLLAGGMLLAGLWPALYAYRRRLWVEAWESQDGDRRRTLIAIAGRAFQRPEVFEQEHAEVVRAIAEVMDGRPIGPPLDDRRLPDHRAVPDPLGSS